MASTYTPLGVELMATGENAGTWGTKTNVNLQLSEQISGGYITQAIAGTGTTAFTEDDGALNALVASRVIVFTGALSGSRVITFPVGVENFYLIKNGTTEDYSLQLKAASGSGATVTWASGDRTWKIIYFDGVATNTGVYDIGMGDVTLAGTQTLTNKTLTSPKIGTSILDTNGAELALLTATGSAVNEFTLANAAASNGPVLSSTGSSDSNIDININPKGTGVLKSGTAAVKIAGTETMWVPASAMYATTTNPAEAAQVETTALRPDMKVFDFADTADDFVQFSVAFPKSWNEGTVTYQVFWTPSTTNAGNCIFGLQGVAIGDGDTIDVVYGTAVNITDAGIGTVEDQQVSPVSTAITIAGTPAVDQQTYFQLYRDANAGTDTYTGVARVLGIKIFYTTDAANDA
jgi:hypothetical protein